jgi:hypothetical protein
MKHCLPISAMHEQKELGPVQSLWAFLLDVIIAGLDAISALKGF